MPLPSPLGAPILAEGPGAISVARRVRRLGTILRLRHVRPTPVALMRVLLVTSILVPALLFAAVAWRGYREAVGKTSTDLFYASEVAAGQAEDVFDGQNQLTDRVNDLVRGMTADTIIQSEEIVHRQLAAMITRLPQVQGILLADRTGRPLVSAAIYPMPKGVSVGDRDFFRAIIGGYSGIYVSSLQMGAISGRQFFGLSRPWMSNGAVDGVINVAISPGFFRDFYRILVAEGSAGADGKVVALVRDDGEILVRYPDFAAAPSRVSAAKPFFAAIKAKPVMGTYEGRSSIDNEASARLYSYRKVTGYPLYVVAGRSRAVIIAGWQTETERHLALGLPVEAALVVVAWLALRTTRREVTALAQARREIGLRHEAETALLKAQRLEAIGQVTGGVAHDFNNLLMVVMGSAELLEQRADDPVRVRRLAGQIVLAAKHGGAITQQLLTFSRRQMLSPEMVDLNVRLRDFRPLLDHAASQAVRVEWELDPTLKPVRLDPAHFEAAILNLVGNARDALPQGGTIVIRTRNIQVARGEFADLAPGPYVGVAVMDRGTGMEAETAAKAFEPFFTTKGAGRGTGLGLSQVYGFVKQAGGDVRIATARGDGTTVEVIVPAGVDNAAQEPSAVAVSRPRRSTRGEVILVVEDDTNVLETACEQLRDLGYEIVTAGGAAAALDILCTSDRIDVLFSDVVMQGGLNGMQLASEARRIRPDLKVLLTSGYTANAAPMHALSAPLLTKPYDRTQLASALSAVLQEA